MDKKQPYALCLAEKLQDAYNATYRIKAVAELRRQHAEIETLRAGYSAARLEIASLRERVQMLGQLARDVNSRRVMELEAQLEAIGAGGVETLRKRCLHQISEPAVAQAPVASIYVTNDGQREFDDWRVPLPVGRNELFAAPQPAAQASECGNCFEGETDRGHACRKCGGTGVVQPAALAAPAQAAAPITLEEAIAHAKEKSKGGSACAYEHAKLTAWLTELQLLRAARTAPAQAAPVDADVQQDAERWKETLRHAGSNGLELLTTIDAAIAARAAQKGA